MLSAMSLPAHAEGWKLVFSDEFNGRGLDRDKWATRYIYNYETQNTLNDEAEVFADHGNHAVGGGHLDLIARPKDGLGGRFKFESGMIRSRRTFYYGYFETRVFLPSARGVWPGFWLNPDYDADGQTDWPPEIDAFEYVLDGWDQKPQMLNSGVINKTLPKGEGAFTYSHPDFNRKFGYLYAKAPMNAGWHVIGALWKPDSVTIYLDGTKLWTRAYHWVTTRGKLAGPAHVLLNLAVGGSWAGRNGIATDQFPQRLQVDYVRVCQFTAGDEGKPRCGDSGLSPGVDEGRYGAEHDDLPRSHLVAIRLPAKPIRAGQAAPIALTVDAVPTTTDHQLRFTLIDSAGRTMQQQTVAEPIPTSQWSGRVMIDRPLTPDPTLKPGRYTLLAGIGSFDSKQVWRGIPWLGVRPFGRDRFLRLNLGQIVIGPKS